MSKTQVFVPEFGERTAPFVMTTWEQRLKSVGIGVVRISSRLSGSLEGQEDLIDRTDGVFVPFSINGSHKQVLLPETVDAVRYGHLTGKPIYSEAPLTEQLRISGGWMCINPQYKEALSAVVETVIGNDVELIKGARV